MICNYESTDSGRLGWSIGKEKKIDRNSICYTIPWIIKWENENSKWNQDNYVMYLENFIEHNINIAT